MRKEEAGKSAKEQLRGRKASKKQGGGINYSNNLNKNLLKRAAATFLSFPSEEKENFNLKWFWFQESPEELSSSTS